MQQSLWKVLDIYRQALYRPLLTLVLFNNTGLHGVLQKEGRFESLLCLGPTRPSQPQASPSSPPPPHPTPLVCVCVCVCVESTETCPRFYLALSWISPISSVKPESSQGPAKLGKQMNWVAAVFHWPALGPGAAVLGNTGGGVCFRKRAGSSFS